MALTKITPQMFDTSATAHDLNVDNGTFVVDGSASRVGIGTATPSTLLHILTASNGASTVGAASDELILENSGDAGLTIRSGSSSDGVISFADADDHNIGQVYYSHSNNTMTFRTNDAIAATINSSGVVTASAGFVGPLTGNVTGTILTAAQANITSLGTLSSLTISGDLTVDTSTLKVDSSNNRVGIGNISPNRQLSLKHASQAEIGFKTGSVSNGALIYYNDSEDKLLLRAQETSDRIEFQTGGTTERLRIDSSGDVRFAANATGAALIKGISGDQVDRNSGGYPQFTFVGNEGTGMRRVSSNVLAFDNSGDESMRITSDGNVGVNTSAVRATMHIKSADNNWESGLLIENNSGNKGWNFHPETNGELLIGYNAATNASLTNQAASIVMKLETSGNVGIGASTVDTKLHLEESGATSLFIKTENSAGALLVGCNASGNSFVSAQTTGKPLILETQNTERMRITDAGDVSIASGGGLYFNSTRSTSTNAQAYIKESGLNLDIKGNDNVRLLGDGGNVILHADYTGQVQVQADLLINPGSTGYRSHTNVDEYLFTVQTSYNANGSQNLNIVNHNGNWTDGTTGTDSAYGLMWGYENSIRAGIHYDHRGSEKFDFYSSYAPIRFRVPPSVSGNISPIGSETTMPSALAIAPGGLVGIGPGSNGAPAPNALLSVVGSNSNTGSDAALFVDSGGSNDWNIKTRMVADYGFNIQSSTGLDYAFYINDNSAPYSQRFRIGGNGAAYHSGTTAVTSDERKKKNIVDMPSQWDEFKQIRWRNFEWKDGAIEGTQFGVIAQEIQAFNPDLIIVDPQTKEEIDDGIEDPKMLSVMYEMLHTKGMKALQEAMERIETLEAEVKALKK